MLEHGGGPTSSANTTMLPVAVVAIVMPTIMSKIGQFHEHSATELARHAALHLGHPPRALPPYVLFRVCTMRPLPRSRSRRARRGALDPPQPAARRGDRHDADDLAHDRLHHDVDGRAHDEARRRVLGRLLKVDDGERAAQLRQRARRLDAQRRAWRGCRVGWVGARRVGTFGGWGSAGSMFGSGGRRARCAAACRE